MTGGELLIVCHGRGRGRHPGSIKTVLDDIARYAPTLRDAIVVHPTGGRRSLDLRNVRTVLFWLADPLRELYPDCFAEAAEIARQARDAGARLANPPEALSNSIKSVQADLWAKAGIPTPAHRRFETRAELDRLAGELPYPLLVKSDQLHSQSMMRLCRTEEDVRALPEAAVAIPGSAVPFVDTREGYRATRPGSIWARYYHKKRVFVLGDIVHPRHTLFSANPIVGLKNSTIRPYGGNAPRQLLPGNATAHACIEADNAFWSGAPEQPDMMRSACRALGIDAAAIDYASHADGRIVLWEANPYFFLISAGRYILPKERRFEERYRSFYSALCQYLQSLLDPIRD